MKNNRVLHFVRKTSQLNSSFIINQITNHFRYEPYIVFRMQNSLLADKVYYECNNLKVKYLNLSENETIIDKIKFHTFKTLSKNQISLIGEFIEKNKIDLCHFHYGSDCGVFYPFLKFNKIPSVVSFYGYDAYSFPKRLLGYGKHYLYKRVFTMVNYILAMTPEMGKDLVKIGSPERKIQVHYHGVPSELFTIKNNYSRKESGEITLLNISYFDPVKGHIFLFRAIERIIKWGFSNIKLRIGGYGFLESELKKYVNENHLDKYISFIGQLKYGSPEMIDEYRNADIFIHPSVLTKDDKEGIPGAIVEAMFAGLPVISTYHGGIPYIIENNKTGLLVKEWDVEGLANGIKNLMIDKDYREKLGKNGQEYALNFLDLSKKEQELENIYERLIHG